MGKLEHDLADYEARENDDYRKKLWAKRTVFDLELPYWMSNDMIDRYRDAQIENLIYDRGIDDPEDWHSDAVEHCTCVYCKAEFEDAYAESLEVLKNENKTTWRTK